MKVWINTFHTNDGNSFKQLNTGLLNYVLCVFFVQILTFPIFAEGARSVTFLGYEQFIGTGVTETNFSKVNTLIEKEDSEGEHWDLGLKMRIYTSNENETLKLINSLEKHTISLEKKTSGSLSHGHAKLNVAIQTSKKGTSINGNVLIDANGYNIHNSIVASNNGYGSAEAQLIVAVSISEPSDVYITNCDLFDKTDFDYQKDFLENGRNCSFKVLGLQKENRNINNTEDPEISNIKSIAFPSKFLINQIVVFDLHVESDYLLEPKEKRSDNFSINIKAGCPIETKIVNVSNGNRPHTLEKNYARCSRDIVSAVNGNTVGLRRIGGPLKRCIKIGPKKTKLEWYEETNGSCKGKDGKIDKWKEIKKFDSEPLSGRCKKTGPPKTKIEMYEETSGICKTKGYKSSPSSHSSGYGLDLFVNNQSKPIGCELEAGDNIVRWATTNGDKYGIKNVIWNKRIYKKSKAWVGEKYNGGAHYNHVHIQCEDIKIE